MSIAELAANETTRSQISALELAELKTGAVQALGRAIQAIDDPGTIRTDPAFKVLADHPGFVRLLEDL